MFSKASRLFFQVITFVLVLCDDFPLSPASLIPFIPESYLGLIHHSNDVEFST